MKAQNNSIDYWKNKEPLRVAETIEDLNEINHQIRTNSTKFKNFYFKIYKNPVSSAREQIKYMKQAEKNIDHIREKIRKK